jgi:AcrR family transcriptional regulator
MIIRAAEKLFYEKGFDKVTMDEIAEAVELSKGSLYLSFKNKDSLFFAIVARNHREYLEELRKCMKEPASGGGQIRRMIQCLVDFSKNHREYNDMACTFGPLIWSRMDAEDERALAENAMEYNRWLHDTIRRGMEDGSIRKDLDPALFGFYLSLISISVVSPLPSWKKGLGAAGISYDRFVDHFLMFISPSIDPCRKNKTPDSSQNSGKD